MFFQHVFHHGETYHSADSRHYGTTPNKIDDYISRADEVKRQAEESLEKYRSALSKATAEADKTLEKPSWN